MFKERLSCCPLCKSRDISFKYEILSYSNKFTTDICNSCGFIFMNPQFDDETIKSFYSEQYYSGKSDYSYIDERGIKKYSSYVWDSRLKIIRKFAKGGNFLDVGCAFGGFLERASKWYIPFGIEISDYAATHAKKIFGDNIHHGTIFNHPFQAESFSVITMIELIEHLSDPKKAIEECYKLLKKDGLLLIQTANMDGLQAKSAGPRYEYFMPGHLSYFSKKNLCKLLRTVGFSYIKVFQPVEFGLLPKLLKSRGSFKSFKDYKAWIRIATYHYKSKIHCGDFALTSSMVVYAIK